MSSRPLNVGVPRSRQVPTFASYTRDVVRKVKVQGPNGPVDGSEIGFRTAGEHWNEYLLDDGTVVRIKLVATNVIKVDGQYDELGNPAYLVQSTNVVNVSSPDNLKRQ